MATELSIKPVEEVKPTSLNTTDTTNNSVTADSSNQTQATIPVTDGPHANLADNTYMSAATVPSYVLELRQAYETAIVNQHFLGDRKKVEKAIAVLTLVDPETRVRAQLETNAYKTLRAKAAKKAEEPGGIYVAPPQDEIDKYIEDGLKVWRDKQK